MGICYWFHYCLGIRFNLLSTWGNCEFIGLTGIQVLGEDGEPIPLSSHSIKDVTLNDKAANSPVKR